MVVTVSRDDGTPAAARTQFKSEMAALGVSVVFLEYVNRLPECSPIHLVPEYAVPAVPAVPITTAQMIVSGGGALPVGSIPSEEGAELRRWSRAARGRMSKAQREGWDKFHKELAEKSIAPARTVSPESRQRMSAAQRKRRRKESREAHKPGHRLGDRA